MNGPRWFGSPLAGTAGVLLGLGLLAIPLHRLTSSAPVAAVRAAAVSTKEIPAVLRVRTLATATHITVRTIEGKNLIDVHDVAPGETEHDAVIPFEGATVDLVLQADFGDAGADTAVFLTVMPDGHEDQEGHVIGSGRLEETLHFEWKAR